MTPGIPYHLGQGLGGLHGNWPTNQAIHSDPTNGAGAAGQQAAYQQAFQTALAAQLANYNACTPTPRKPLENTGLKVGEIIGYRMWRVNDGYLVSYSASHAWPPDEVMKGDPKEDNDEGIWAFREKSRALNKMLKSGDTVMGSVKMWGRIIEHTEGYRAEFAKIVSLDAMRPRDNKLLQKICQEYGV